MTEGRAREFFLGKDSPLKSLEGYEPRPQQAELSIAVARAFDDCESLCAEAPTGTGKTVAYLVPAVLLARETGLPAIVSTDTIALQRQMAGHDMPLVSRLLDTPIRAAVSKGASNYLCLRRLERLADDSPATALAHAAMMTDFIESAAMSAECAKESLNIPDALFSKVRRDASCLSDRCPFFTRCPFQRARRGERSAEIIVMNHALLFARVASDVRRGLEPDSPESALPPRCALILDEAHAMEDAATRQLSASVSSSATMRLLSRLGPLLKTPGEKEALEHAKDALSALFRPLLRLQDESELPQSAVKAAIDAADALESLGRRLPSPEPTALARSLRDIADADPKEYVRYASRDEQGGASLTAAPKDVSRILRERIFSRPPVIATSATLSASNSMSFFKSRTGCDDARELILDSPFDFASHVVLHLARNMPDPRDGRAFAAASADAVKRLLLLTNAHAFILFTSRASMLDMSSRLAGFIEARSMTMLVQDGSMTRGQMLRLFLSSPNPVLLGLDSFWTGVDVPGPALTNVIIAKLPFPVPDTPLARARLGRASENKEGEEDEEGMAAFFQYSLPLAITRFRQGFGRLMRRKTDSGIVAVLDPRITTKGYGRAFLDSIPHCETVLF